MNIEQLNIHTLYDCFLVFRNSLGSYTASLHGSVRLLETVMLNSLIFFNNWSYYTSRDFDSNACR